MTIVTAKLTGLTQASIGLIVAPLLLGAVTTSKAYGENSLVLEEVIVTARKREESLQETPLSVSAFSPEALTEAGVTNMAGFNKIIPNIEVQNGNGQSGVANVYIRGVGQRNTEPNLDSGVGIYLDGVYLARADGALLDINDVESVQVLRGPQGTLFGKNTTGGALVFTTKKPSDELEGKVMLRAGDFGRLDGQLSANLPLIEETLFTRLSLSSVNRDGYFKNVADGKDYNDEERLSAVWQTRWIVSDSLVADLNVNYAKTAQLGRPGNCTVVPGAEGWQAVLQDGLIEGATGLTIAGHCQANHDLGPYKINSDFAGGVYNAENKGASLTLDWEINESLSFKSVTAWKAVEAFQGSDIDSSGVSLVARSNDPDFSPDAQPRDNSQYSQEFQFIGDAFDQRLQYVAGLYYFREKTEDSVTFGIAGGPFFAANLGATDLYFARNSGTGLDTDNEAKAAFLQADWSFTDSLKFTAGIRYTTEDRELVRTRYVPIPETYSNDPTIPATDQSLISPGLFSLPAGRPDLVNPVPRLQVNTMDPDDPDGDGITRGDISNDDWTPMFSLQYLFEGGGFINGGTAYLTYSEGFRSGGLSEGPGNELEEFEPETVTNVELGIKLDAWNNRLRANFALFNADYDDRQLTTIVVNPDNGSIAGRTINAARSTIRGVEAEITLLPVENLQLTLNLALNDGEIKEYEDVQLTLFDITTPVEADSLGVGCIDTGQRTRPPAAPRGVEQCAIDRSDENLPRLPDQTIFFAAQYFIETDIGTFVPRISYSQKDNIDSCFDRNSCLSGLMVFDHKDVSARLTWLSNDDRWRVALYGSNLTEEDHGVGGTALTDFTGTAGTSATVPRMYGAEFEFTW